MAKKKAPAAAAKPGRDAQSALPEDTQRLHRFFRGLYQDPKKADQFNGGPKARQKLLAASDLSDAHKKLIKRGCIPDVIHALVGAPAIAAAYTSMVDCQDGFACDHPECHALTAAANPAAAKPGAAKRKTAAPAKNRR
jgi:hypothetical protein